jgi:hypothetical protein
MLAVLAVGNHLFCVAILDDRKKIPVVFFCRLYSVVDIRNDIGRIRILLCRSLRSRPPAKPRVLGAARPSSAPGIPPPPRRTSRRPAGYLSPRPSHKGTPAENRFLLVSCLNILHARFRFSANSWSRDRRAPDRPDL